MAIDSRGYPHIIYQNARLSVDNLKYAFWNGTDYEIEFVDTAQDSGNKMDIEVDSENRPHILYFNKSNNVLTYGHKNDTGWHKQSILNFTSGVIHFDMAIDNNDYPAIFAYDRTNLTTVFIKWEGSRWNRSIIKNGGCSYPNIRYDEDGTPHIAFTTYGVNYGFWNGTAWDMVELTNRTGNGQGLKMALNSSGNPCFIHYENYWGNEELFLIYHNGTNWNEAKIDEYDDYAYELSIVVDGDDNIHMVYHSDRDRFLNYSSFDGATFSNERLVDSCVDPLPNLRRTPEGNILMSYAPSAWMEIARLNFEELNITSPSMGEKWERGKTYTINWTTEHFETRATFSIELYKEDTKKLTILDSVKVSQGHYNWTVPGDLDTGWSYRINLIYLDHDHIADFGNHFGIFPQQGWFHDKVISDYNYLKYPSMVLGPDEVPYILGYYTEYQKEKLVLSHYENGTWSFEDVDTNNKAGQYSSSLVFNSSGVEHISYFTGLGYDLKFAVRNGTGWDISTIDYLGDVGFRHQLVVDENDVITLVYNDMTVDSLKYGRWNGKQWDITTILSGYDPYFSFALDDDGRPHVIYTDRYHIHDLHYNGTSWITDDIFSIRGHYSVTTMEIDAHFDSAGGLHVTYCNNSARPYLEYLYINDTTTTHQVLRTRSGYSTGLSPDIEIGPDDEPSMTFVEYDPDYTVYFGFRENGNWTFWRLLDERTGQHDLILDGNGDPHIVLRVENIFRLRYMALISDPITPSKVLDLDHEMVSGHVSLSWAPPINDGGMNIIGYSIFRENSTQNLTLLANVTGKTLLYLDTTTIPMETYVYRVAAFNAIGVGNRSDPINLTVDIPILLVDDDLWYTYESHFKDALTSAGYQYRTWNVYASGASPPLSNLSLYESVIWTTGADSISTLSASDQTLLMNYLDSGGKLFLSSQELLFDIGGEADGAISNTFINDYLKIWSVDNDVSYSTVDGVDGDVIATPFPGLNLDFPYTNYGDEYDIYPNGTTIFTNPSNGNTAGHRVDNDTYRIVFLSFPFEAVNKHDSANGTQLMGNIVEWLLNDPGTPSPPIGLTASAGDGYVQLDWSYPLDNGSSALSGFKLYRRAFSTGTITQVNLSSSTFSYNDTSTSNSEVYYYLLKAYNSYGDSGNSREIKSDIVSPTMGTDSTPTIGTTGDGLTFSVQATDNVRINGVSVEYWYGSGTHTIGSMSGPTPYTHRITVPSGSITALRYRFRIVDGAFNVLESDVRTVSISDNDRPTFGTDNSQTSGTTGDLFTFAMETFDNIEVSSTHVEFWYGSGTHRNLSFISVKIITIPSDSTDTLHYIFTAGDDAGNWNATTVKDVTITDNDLPSFGSDLSSITATTGDPISLNISASDNVGIGTITVEYWYGSGSHSNTSMNGTGPYDLTIIAPSGSTDRFNYRFHASDPGGNWIETDAASIDITDDDRPTFSSDTTPTSATTGEQISLGISARDNIDLYDVTVEYWHGYGPHFNLSMTGSGTYSRSITAPLNSLVAMSYKFHAVDAEGNWADTPTGAVLILDNDMPSYFNDVTPTSSGTGDPINFSVRASDNVGVKQVRLQYYLGSSGQILNISVPGEDHFNITIVAPWNSTDDMYYRYQVEDTSGNWWMWSNYKAISIYDDDSPHLVNDLTPDEAGTGDMLSFAVQAVDNIAIDTLTLEYWYGEGTHLTLPMSGSGPYLVDLMVREDTLDPLHYFIKIEDTASNSVQTEETVIKIIDNDAPSVSITNPVTSIATGAVLNITALVSDNLAPNSVWIEFGFGNGPMVNQTMVLHEGLYHMDIEIPSDMVDDLKVRISSSDLSENIGSTGLLVLEVEDMDPPRMIADLSDSNATTGDDFFFEVDITDNIGLKSVYVEYTIDGSDLNRIYLIGAGPFTGSIKIPDNTIGELIYQIYFEDVSGNLNSSGSVKVRINDNDLPVILDNYSDTEAYTGDEFTFLIVARDNYGVHTVNVEFETLIFNKTIRLGGDGSYHGTLHIPEWGVETLDYRVIVEDLNGNTIMESYSVEVLDNDPPELLSVNYSGPLRSNSDVTVDVNIGDNLGLGMMEILYTYGDVEGEKMLIESAVRQYSARFPVGEYTGLVSLKIRALDSSGNVLETDLPPLFVADGIPPTIDRIEDVEVLAGELFNITISAQDNMGTVSIIWEGLPFAGDGSFVSGSVDEPGIYEVLVIVTDPDGNEVNGSFQITVDPSPLEDRDGDGMDDLWEEKYQLDPDDPEDAGGDLDGDGVTNLEEYILGWDPTASDVGEGSTEGGIPVIVVILLILIILILMAFALFLFLRKGSAPDTGPVEDEPSTSGEVEEIKGPEGGSNSPEPPELEELEEEAEPQLPA
ncbi:MAG: hypothetical protein KAH57_10130 [Thermoplasmata archaeon]|nr:hypothetical protein [Thermoplasmata archaeon]